VDHQNFHGLWRTDHHTHTGLQVGHTKIKKNNLMSWRLLIYLTCLAIYFILFSCQSNQEGKVLKLAHGLDIAHPVHKGMVYMAERVEKHSEGKDTDISQRTVGGRERTFRINSNW